MITAAWLITISFIIDNYLSGSSSTQAFQKNISSYIAKQENAIDAITRDTALIKKLANKEYGEVLLEQLEEKKFYFLFIQKMRLAFMIFFFGIPR